MTGTVRIIKINVHLFIARVALRRHHVLNVVEERVQSFVHDESSLFLGILKLLVLVLGRLK